MIATCVSEVVLRATPITEEVMATNWVSVENILELPTPSLAPIYLNFTTRR